MDISVRLEGGLGDCLLGNRFVAAIRDKHPDARIHAFFDTEGNKFQEQALRATYRHFYETFTTIPKKKFEKFMIESQFGREEYKAALENVPDEFRAEMDKSDKFYDLHIDGLKWIDYDFDWVRHHRVFPKPAFTNPYVGELPKDFIVVSLASHSSSGSKLQGWYIKRLIHELSQILPVVAISTVKTRQIYEDLNTEALIVTTPLDDVIELELISHAKLMVSIDSGLKYIGYACGVPTLTLSPHSPQPHQIIPSHQLRWLVFPELCFPLNYSSSYVTGIAKKILSSSAYALLPTLGDNLDQQIVRRHYKLLS